MVMASTNSTDGNGFPTDIGEPSNFTGFPLKDTCVPGCAEPQSIGILGWVVAHPENENIKKIKGITKFFILPILYLLLKKTAD
jgi:hypothetical protein